MRVLVTGASRGIGLAISQSLHEEGHQVIGFARSTDAPFPGELIACDLGDSASVAVALEACGEVDGVVNNAGINTPQSLDTVDLDVFDRMMAVNARAPMQIVRTLARGMRERRFGRIVNISSRAWLGLENHSSYAATKAALAAMGRCWALELAAYGVTVNTVAPGPIETELFASVMPKDDPKTQAYLRSIPVQRIGQPDDIASLVSYLLSERAGFITGQTVHACGGLTVGRLQSG